MNSSASPGLNDLALLAQACGPGFDVSAQASIASTNLTLMQRPFGPVPARPFLLAADEQTAGRGRRGRTWHGDPTRSLMLSIALERPVTPLSAPMTGWPIAVGVALAQALGDLVPDLRLKWPNDLLRPAGKCGGVLIETRRSGVGQSGIERVVTGIGMNLWMDDVLQDRIDQPVCGLFDGPPARRREQLAGQVANSVLQAWHQFLDEGLAAFAQRWSQLDALAGRQVVVIESGQVLMQGLADGVDALGALRVIGPSGLQQVTVGDVSVRPVPSMRPPQTV